MGIIHVPKTITERCFVFDLSTVQENQTLLTHHLNDLLRNTQPSGNGSGEETDHDIPQSVLAHFRNFQLVDNQEPILDFDRLFEVYARQYALVELALQIGESQRVRARETARINSGTPMIYQTDHNEDRYQAIVGFANRRLTPEGMKAEIDRVRRICNVGDIVDIVGYRGTGYYLVTEKLPNGSVRAVKTRGQYGCHLPSEAFPMIKQYGFEYFERADVWACYLPEQTRIRACNEGIQMDIQDSSSHLIAWLHGSDGVEIDGISYVCELLTSSGESCE